MGRGRTSWGHIGNRWFRNIVGLHLKQYMDTNSRPEKSKIVQTIYDELMDAGGRFLKLDQSSGLWYPVDRKMAREKIAHALRDAVGMRIKLPDTPIANIGTSNSNNTTTNREDARKHRSTFRAANNAARAAAAVGKKDRGSSGSVGTDSTASTLDDTKDDPTNGPQTTTTKATTTTTTTTTPQTTKTKAKKSTTAASKNSSATSTKKDNSRKAVPPPPTGTSDATPRATNFSRKFLPQQTTKTPRSVSVPTAAARTNPPGLVAGVPLAQSVTTEYIGLKPPKGVGHRALSHDAYIVNGAASSKNSGGCHSTLSTMTGDDPEVFANLVSHVLNDMESNGELMGKSSGMSTNSRGSSSSKKWGNWLEDDLTGGFSVMSLDSSKKSKKSSKEDTSVKSKMSLEDIDVSEEFGFDTVMSLGAKMSAGSAAASVSSSTASSHLLHNNNSSSSNNNNNNNRGGALHPHMLHPHIPTTDSVVSLGSSTFSHISNTTPLSVSSADPQGLLLLQNPQLQQHLLQQQQQQQQQLLYQMQHQQLQQEGKIGGGAGDLGEIDVSEEFGFLTSLEKFEDLTKGSQVGSVTSSSVGTVKNDFLAKNDLLAFAGDVSTPGTSAIATTITDESNNNNNNNNNNGGTTEDMSVRTSDTEREWRKTVKALAAV